MRATSLASLVIVFLWMFIPGTASAEAAPDSENGRFAFSPVVDGVLRLDTRSGQVSHCLRRNGGWACEAVPDERAALESEIGRLQRENANLKKELLALGAPLPGVRRPDSSSEWRLPSDADLDRAMSFVEKMWRRLVDMVQGAAREYQK